MTRRYPVALIGLTLCLCACGPGQQDDVGGVSAAEASALNDAAATLDARTGATAASGTGLNPAATLSRNRHAGDGGQPIAPRAP